MFGRSKFGFVITCFEASEGSNGKQMVADLVPALRAEFGRGCSAQHLRRCLRPTATFPDEAKLSAVQRQLNWTPRKTAIYIEDPFKRNIYLELCPQCEGWLTQRLSERIKSMFHERTTISKKTEIGSERFDGTKRTPVNIYLSITNPQHREYSSKLVGVCDLVWTPIRGN